ncbi:DUF924 family protein [Pisciglobus halotolerans]|uniref:Uncharacterized conserved protein, DUF924 family n=1 Tax=Pisciglobus halotolerans TaxID=745365 RepID=A0A1I3DT00_9LACT|nr:DUF924 family protein [Pisciglobus halotolerans]SFH89688.1 Uncharacterized conserved protein, DUF924 family [Pisciglobus halotolerans]
MEYRKVLDFWFNEVDPKKHFEKDEGFDQEIYTRFNQVHQQAVQGELAHWRTTLEGCLAEIIVLDQFSRNIYRGDPRSFAYDGMALVLAQEAIEQYDVSTLSKAELSFLYMPFMHSESLVIHEKALEYFHTEGLAEPLKFEIAHHDILVRFGRYPHRNEILGRASTPEEVAFLKQPGSSF